MRNIFYFQAHALFVSLGWFCWVRFVVSVPVPSWGLYHQKARHFGVWYPVALVNTWEIKLIVTMLQRSLKQVRPFYIFHWINICGACFNLLRSNRPFPSCLLPLFQNESFKWKFSLPTGPLSCKSNSFFLWKLFHEDSHEDSFWKRGTRLLGNDLLAHQI